MDLAHSPPETRYATNELEALAIYYAIKDCHFYLYGSKFTVVTDHKPLLGTFKKDLFDIENVRLQRIREKLTNYAFEVIWSPGKCHLIADALSRAPVFHPGQEEQVTCNVELAYAIAEDPILQPLYDAAEIDSDYQETIKAFVEDKRPEHLPPTHPARILKSFWDDISIFDDVLLVYKDNRIYVPKNYRSSILDKLHLSHCGISKTKALARQLFFWPGLTKEIETRIANCEDCRRYSASQSSQPVLHSEEATFPLQAVGTDLFEYSGNDYIVMVDRFSNYIWVKRLPKTDTASICAALDNWFLDYGYPSTIISDNGPQFRTEFKAFCFEHSIVHNTSSPYNPRSNGAAESAVKSAKGLLKKSANFNDFRKTLQAWRNTPSAITSISPAERLFGYRQRFGLPTLHQRPLSATPREETLPSLTPGQKVELQNPFNQEWDEQGTVASVCPSQQSYEITRTNGKNVRRNRRFLRPLLTSIPEIETDSRSANSILKSTQSNTLRRSTRERRPTVRFAPV